MFHPLGGHPMVLAPESQSNLRLGTAAGLALDRLVRGEIGLWRLRSARIHAEENRAKQDRADHDHASRTEDVERVERNAAARRWERPCQRCTKSPKLEY